MTPAAVAYIGLGANLGDAAATLRQALLALDRLPGLAVLKASSLYSTPAWGQVQQPDFVNAVAMVRTRLDPHALLDALLQVEREFGRSRDVAERWGPRTLDLDLLLHADTRVDAPGLTVPHPQMHLRAFVLVPLLELDPDVVIPGRGAARDALEGMCITEIRRLPS